MMYQYRCLRAAIALVVLTIAVCLPSASFAQVTADEATTQTQDAQPVWKWMSRLTLPLNVGEVREASDESEIGRDIYELTRKIKVSELINRSGQPLKKVKVTIGELIELGGDTEEEFEAYDWYYPDAVITVYEGEILHVQRVTENAPKVDESDGDVLIEFEAPEEEAKFIWGEVLRGLEVTESESMMLAGVILLVLFAIYIFVGLCLFMIADKTNTSGAWMAWIPILQIYLMVKIGGKGMGWFIVVFILLMIPLINYLALVLLFGDLFRASGKPYAAGVVTGLFFPLTLPLLAWPAFA